MTADSTDHHTEIPVDLSASRLPSPGLSASGSMPYLLTPGPLTTAESVKESMLCDWGSWDQDFKSVTARVRDELLAIAGTTDGYACIPMQGSGTFVVEAMLGSFIPPDAKTLVLANGAYGHRIAETLSCLGREFFLIDKGDFLPPRATEVAEFLNEHPDITDVVVVHCETSSGILNPVQEIAQVVKDNDCRLLIDSMSAFGAIPISPDDTPYDVLVSSANKCIEGVPGFGFLIVKKSRLTASESHSHSLALNVIAQWEYMEKTGQWRFTPPTHSVVAFQEALRLHRLEGGVEGRLARYTANRDTLVNGMRGLGFETLLSEPWLSPIIVTFFNPIDPAFQFKQFYELLKKRGFIIYPGKLTKVDSFRVGCIGHLDHQVMTALVQAVEESLKEMGVASGVPCSDALRERALLAS